MISVGDVYTDNNRLYIIRRADNGILVYDDCYPNGETLIRWTSAIQFEHDVEKGEIWKIE